MHSDFERQRKVRACASLPDLQMRLVELVWKVMRSASMMAPL